MKYNNAVIINAPREKVVELFDNPENLHKWLPAMQSFEPISGDPGQPGAKSKVVFQEGQHRMEMTETVLERNLPEAFTGQYEAGRMRYVIRNRFIDLGNNKTRYVNENEFQLPGFMKVAGWLMPGAFKKESQKHLEAFKTFVESQHHSN